MKTYLGLSNKAVCLGPAVLTIGLFDGVHQGHQHLLGRAREVATSRKASLVVFTFRSLPRVDRNLITTSYHKKVLLEQLGVDILVELRLSREIKKLSPGDFLLAVDAMFPLSSWVVGEDVHFGANRSGDRAFLAQYASGDVLVVDPYFRKEFSSSKVRECIQDGEISRASFLLGRTYSIMAKAASLEELVLTIDGSDLCLPSVGKWQSLVRLGGDENDIPSRLSISEKKECRLDLFGKFALPRILFVEVIPVRSLDILT